MSSSAAVPESDLKANVNDSVRVAEKGEIATSEIEFLTGWRYAAIGISIVLSMFLVSSQIDRHRFVACG